MSPRIAFALLSAVFVLAAPATASGQAPVDERANAHAFADIGVRLAADFAAAGETMEARFAAAPACLSAKPLARKLQRAPERRVEAVFALFGTQVIGDYARTVDPSIVRALAQMHAIPTAEPALRGGRTAWRRIHRVYSGFAALPAADVCREARAFVRSGFRRTPAMRRAQRALHVADHTGGIDRRLARAVTRLEQLGVPAADANVFDGPFSD